MEYYRNIQLSQELEEVAARVQQEVTAAFEEAERGKLGEGREVWGFEGGSLTLPLLLKMQFETADDKIPDTDRSAT